MGGLGQGFAQSFMAMQQIGQQRQELDQRKQEADLRGKLMDLQMQQLQKKMQSGEILRDLMTQQQGGGAGFQGESQEFAAGNDVGGMTPPQPPRALSMRELAAAITPVDPEGGVKMFIDAEKADREQHKQDQAQAFAEKLVGQVLPGGLGAAAGQKAPATAMPAGAPGAQQTQQAEGQPLRSSSPEFQGFTLDPTTGKLNLKFGQSELEIKDSNIETSPGSGIFFHRRDFHDKRTGATVGTQIMGRPVTGEGMARVESMVRSWGLNPLSEMGQAAVGDVFTAMAYQGDEQNIALQRVRDKYFGLAASQGAPGFGGGGATSGKPAAGGGAAGRGSVIDEAQSRKLAQVTNESRAKAIVQREEDPPQAADRNRMIQLQSIERQGGIVRDTFRPEFVGKGFKAFSGELKKEYEAQEKAAQSGKYASGALAGGLRKFMGKASPDEVQFRAALLDMSDLLLRARSGAQINEQEYQRLKSLLPDLYDEPNTFIPALRRFTVEAGKQLDDTLKLGGTGMRDLQQQREQEKKKAVPKIKSIVPEP
jgi:hypothetical protein